MGESEKAKLNEYKAQAEKLIEIINDSANISHSGSSTSSGIASLGNTTAFFGCSQKFSVAELNKVTTI